jgi:stress-induced morphogen
MASVNEVQARIAAAFPGAQLHVTDPRGTSSYFDVRLVTPAFAGVPRIRRHRMVMDLFDAELKSGEIHALALQTLTPDDLNR